MSYSSSGAVATLWSPSNYSGTTKMPVPSTTRRYSSTSGTTSYRTTGTTERPYLSSTTGSSFSSASRIQTDYRSRYSNRSSTSVPTSYSRLTEIHETSSRIGNKDRSEVNDSSLLSYTRSKTDNDVTAAWDRCGFKTDSYKLRTDSESSRFLNTSKLDLKYSLNRKFGGGTSLDLTKFNSSLKSSSKVTDFNSRLPRKDSLTKSDNADTSPSPIRSLERKGSTNASGSSPSPIEMRKSSEVWNKTLSGSYESSIKECYEGDLFEKIDNENQACRENGEELSESSIVLENIEDEEKTLSFAEIRRKFDNNDSRDVKGGSENSVQKSSHSKDSRASISNGIVLGVHYQYLDRNLKNKKVTENSGDDADLGTICVDQLDINNSFPSSQTLHGLSLKSKPSSLKCNSNSSNNSSNNNNNPAYSIPRESPDPIPDLTNNRKKRSLPDLKKAILSSEKKEVHLPSMVRLNTTCDSSPDIEHKPDGGTGKGPNENKRELRKTAVSGTLGTDNKNDIKIQAKRRGEKLTVKLEQTLAKPSERDAEMLNTLSKMRRSSESKPKDVENETKVIELRKVEPFTSTPFEGNNKIKEVESKDKKLSTSPSGVKQTDKSLQKSDKQAWTSAGKDAIKPPAQKESEANLSPPACSKEVGAMAKAKRNSSPKDEKETSNARERELNKRLFNEEPLESKPAKKAGEKLEADAAAKETPLLDKTEIAKGFNNRTLAGPNSYQNSNTYSSNNNLENAGIHGTSPRLNVGYSRNSGIEKGGLNGLRNIGNTCFMNSVIQCLSNTKPLLEYLLNEEYLADINTTISGMKGALIKAFSNVIQELWAPNAEAKIINTINFKSQIQRFAPRFMGYSQQDAQEFLRYLLEGLHEDVNRVTAKPKPITTDIDDTLSDNQKATEAWKRYLRMDDSKVVDIFVGQLKSTLQCTVCGHCSVTFDPFWDLSLPVPSRNGQLRLSSCLDAFTKEEVLDGDEKPTCSKCKTRRKCTKSFSIQKFPKILVLQPRLMFSVGTLSENILDSGTLVFDLYPKTATKFIAVTSSALWFDLKRFSPTERYRGKLSVTVEFPLTNLDLTPYAANRGQACAYNLYAISNHSGTAFSGHYTAYCKHPYTGNWHEYNDSGVSSLSSRSVVSGEAYVLFYELNPQTSHL